MVGDILSYPVELLQTVTSNIILTSSSEEKEIKEIKIPIDEIIIGDRIRKDFGDLNPLANSIKKRGYSIHPIAINRDKRLVAGHRLLLKSILNLMPPHSFGQRQQFL